MMTQGLLPFQYQIEESEFGMTSFAGLPLYMAMATWFSTKIAVMDLLKDAVRV